jgi:hypothetical protein
MENKTLVKKALHEIIDVHHRHLNFAALRQQQPEQYIENNSVMQ